MQMKNGSALKSFKSLAGFLLVFLLGNIIFKKVTGRVYITPSIGGGNDLLENRKPGIADFVMFGMLFFSIIGTQEL